MSVTTIKQITAVDLLSNWLEKQVSQDGYDWLKQQRHKIIFESAKRVFFTAFSAVPRYTGKQELQLCEAEIQAARAKYPGWSPQFWRVDRAARSLLVLSLIEGDRELYLKTLDRVFATADVEELVALYQMLPLLPEPQEYRLRAAEGIRSNMTVVFNAVALNNPYPTQYFDEAAWNQMVLKALFVGSPLYPIQGLDRRTNPTLSMMLIDYARERWAAKRSVSPELWRAMGEFADRTIITDWKRILADSEPVQRMAVALACNRCSLPEAQSLLSTYPNLQESINSGGLTWASLEREVSQK